MGLAYWLATGQFNDDLEVHAGIRITLCNGNCMRLKKVTLFIRPHTLLAGFLQCVMGEVFTDRNLSTTLRHC